MINIAFNQLEVHLHNAKGDEVTEVARDLNGRPGAALRSGALRVRARR